MSAQIEFNNLVDYLGSTHGGVAGKMFGKKCIKINDKVGVALFKDFLVFKLHDNDHKQAIALTGSVLWDPSGKGRPMKQWVQISMDHKSKYKEFAKAAADYVG